MSFSPILGEVLRLKTLKKNLKTECKAEEVSDEEDEDNNANRSDGRKRLRG